MVAQQLRMGWAIRMSHSYWPLVADSRIAVVLTKELLVLAQQVDSAFEA